MYMTVVVFLQQFSLGVEKSKFHRQHDRLADEGRKTSVGVTSSKIYQVIMTQPLFTTRFPACFPLTTNLAKILIGMQMAENL